MSGAQRPTIELSDELWQGRVTLGAVEGDYLPSSSNADWALEFTGPEVPSHILAGIGLLHDISNPSLSGVLTVTDSRGKVFRVP